MTMVIKHKGPLGRGLGHLKIPRDQIRDRALKEGLDFFDTIFEPLDFEEMNMVASYGGFPNRYPHWTFGMEYQRLKKSYEYGLHRIYEMVINNDPCYAYLLKSNNDVDQKIVMAHVYGHCDFFKNNIAFRETNRKMMDVMANHATKVRKYQDKYGVNVVESFIDMCKSIDDLIDPHGVFIDRRSKQNLSFMNPEEEEYPIAKKIPAKEYMNGYINPKEVILHKQEQLDAEHQKQKQIKKKQHLPENSQKDVLLFLVEHAPLEDWQKDILCMIREEAYYFAPQAETKIMNEGWATYWHQKIMMRLLTDAEIVDFADHHAGTIAAGPGQINPYRLGWQLWKDIEDRWNKGKFGNEYEDCDLYEERKNWDKKLGLGKEKIFQVRKIYNDITFIDEFFTEEFCGENKYFTYEYDKNKGYYVIVSRKWEDTKRALLSKLTNFGHPFIFAEDGNYQNSGILLLKHRHEGIDLRQDYAQDTLANLFKIWSRPVGIETVIGEKNLIMLFNGEKYVTFKA